MATLYYSNLANLNGGIATSIWQMTPVIVGVLDYLMFDTKLKPHQTVGVGIMIVSMVLISLKDVIYSKQAVNPGIVPTFVPILFSVFCPIAFAMLMMLYKHLVVNNGFIITRLSFLV